MIIFIFACYTNKVKIIKEVQAMNKRRFLQWGVLLMLGIFVLGAAIPALADSNNASTGKMAGIMNRGKALAGMAWGGHGAVKGGAQNMVKAVADITGLDIDTIRQERQAGKSLAAIAQEKGITEDTLISKIVAENQAKIQSLVDSGKMTQAQYDKCIADMQTRAKENLERTTTGKANGQAGKMVKAGGAQSMVNEVAELTGLDVETIRQERQAGKSLATIAQEKGVTEDILISKIVAGNQTKIQSLVDSGKMTQAQYDKCIADMQTRVKENLERTTTGPQNGQGQGTGRGHGPGMKNKANSTPSL